MDAWGLVAVGVVASAAVNNVATWLPLVCAGVLAYVFMRGGGATAIQSLQAANRELEKRVHQLEGRVQEDARTIAELRARTDYAAVIESHERRAIERHEKTLAVLERIADRLEATV